MKRPKKIDPRVAALLDRLERLNRSMERWYFKASRAMRAMERDRKCAKRVRDKLRKLDVEQDN